MFKIVLLFSFLSFHAYGSTCEDFFNARATEIGLGTFGDNDIQTKTLYVYEKNIYPQKMSKTNKASKRLSNHGPTITVKLKDKQFHIMQLFEHEGTVESYRRYNITLNENCSEILDVTYTTSNHDKNGHIVLSVNKDKCQNPDELLNEVELNFKDSDGFGYKNLCQKYYPQDPTINQSTTEIKKSTAKEK